MKIVLVGHRGTGKSSLLKRMQEYWFGLSPFVDLDQFISRTEGDLTQLFSTFGESHFRDLEKKYFSKLMMAESGFVVAVGAGFDLSLIPDEVKVLWVRRDSDSQGRIFLNRPRLNPRIDPLAEYLERFRARETQYAMKADLVYTLPEGLSRANKEEKEILKNLLWGNRPFVTDAFETDNVDRSQARFVPIEVRSDLREISVAVQDLNIPKIYSQRTNQVLDQLNPDHWTWVDWEVSLGPCPWTAKNLILSTHAENIQDGIQELESVRSRFPEALFKLCPRVETFRDLEKGYAWWSQDPSRNNFLPRSEDGRWAWFRLFMKGRQKVNFIRQGVGSAADQPTLYQWISMPDWCQSFAAVLGDPVKMSHSPEFHKNFFAAKDVPYLPICISESEWEVSLKFLENLGLQWASVTSPLKKKVFEFCTAVDEKTKALQSVNTLVLSKNQWFGKNTDFIGLEKVFGERSQESIAVWGGGGLTTSLKSLFPQARFFSAREGCPSAEPSPQILIWASRRSPQTLFPPTAWRPAEVWDMNYSENSMGLEYAAGIGTKYISGQEFFVEQALEQQNFWSSFL